MAAAKVRKQSWPWKLATATGSISFNAARGLVRCTVIRPVLVTVKFSTHFRQRVIGCVGDVRSIGQHDQHPVLDVEPAGQRPGLTADLGDV
ncbi:hypothetical protein MRX96_032432 [Rhipicephalus microplus]